MTNIQKIRKNQAKFKAKKSETHQQLAVWIEKVLLDRVKAAALSHGWVATEGRGAGGPHVNQAIEELLKIGLDNLPIDTRND